MIALAPDEPVGFIGTGVMGRHMAGHVMEAGHPLIVNTRTKAKAEPLLAEGARWANSPSEVAREAKVVCTMLGFPQDVREVYLGAHGLIESGIPGSLFCDFTTSAPTLAEEIERTAAQHDIHVLDAPVSGGDIGAHNATLSIMCGGRQETFDALLPLLEIVGQNVIYQGLAGSGQHAKMCNQIAVAGTMVGVVEALLYAEKAGLDPELVLQSIAHGAAGSWSMNNLAPRILNHNFEPGFFAEHFLKDLDIALEEAERFGLEAPGLKVVRDLYEWVEAMGYGRKGTQVLYLAYKER